MNENTFETFAFCLRFLMDEQNFEGFRSYLLLILAFSDGRKHFWIIRILFDIDFKRFRMNKNTFEAFAYYLPSI